MLVFHYLITTCGRIPEGKEKPSPEPPAGGSLPRRLRWTGRSPGRMREKTLSWERVAGRSPDGCGAALCAFRGWTGRSPGRVWRGHLKVEAWLNWMVKSPNSRRGRCPHRPETWRSEPAGINLPPCCRTLGPMKGIGPYAYGRFLPLNLAHPMLLGSPPHPEKAGPPLIRHAFGRATLSGGEGCLRRGITVYLLCCLSGISPGDSSTGCYTAVERGCEEGDIHKNTPQLFYKLWRNFLGFPGGSGGRAGERVD